MPGAPRFAQDQDLRGAGAVRRHRWRHRCSATCIRDQRWRAFTASIPCSTVLAKQIFAVVQIRERPHLPEGLSSPFDDDGVATHDRDVVRDGVLQGYFLGCYSARKLGMTTTGNAGCPQPAPRTRRPRFRGHAQADGSWIADRGPGPRRELRHGRLPRGAAGFWVENGKIDPPGRGDHHRRQPRRDVQGIVESGNDVFSRGSKQSGSILVDRMKLAGS